MNRRIIGVLLLLVVGVAAIVGAWLLLPYFKEKEQRQTSDSGKLQGKITLALDNWIGYFPLQSPEMKAAMRREGWQLVTENDEADYHRRMERLQKGEIDLAVATVDSFLLNAQAFDFPATIIMVIDESKGGDSILANKDKVKTLRDIEHQSGLRVAFTPDSPSHHLLKATKDHFNLPEILPVGPGRIEAKGSSEAMKMLLSGQADVAVLWEPNVSQALANQGVVKLLGTEDTERLIVDILLVSRRFSQKEPGLVKRLLNNYFRVLKKYRDNHDLLVRHVKEETGASDEVVESMLKGVAWVNFNENCETWFGIASPGNSSEEGLVDTLYSTASILINSGDFKTNPIPGDDPYRLINSSFLGTLFTTGISGFSKTASSQGPVNSIEARFAPLNPAEWDQLKEVGSLKVDPIIFQSGTRELDLLAKQVVDQAVSRLKHYPHFRVVIRGHTGTKGDQEENRRLSQDRAEAVSKYLEITYNMDPNRLKAVGLGGTRPLPKDPGESRRSWEYRLPRVELILVREVI